MSKQTMGMIDTPPEYRTGITAAPATGINIFDSGAFESIARIADMMAQSPLVPETLRTIKVNGKTEALPIEQIKANCFLVIEQAARWQISPFAALGCASVIYGRLMWEGKLVAGVLDALLGVKLNFEFTGSGEKMTVLVTGRLPGEDKDREITGTVAAWKTAQWADGTFEQRMAYRGTREWARRHAPAVLMGVVTDDEAPPSAMRDVTPQGRVIPIESQTDPFKGTALETAPQPAAEPAAPATKKAAPAPNDETLPPNPQTVAPEGRQQKERHERDAKFLSIAEKEGNGKTFYVVAVLIAGKHVEFTTFSQTMAESLRELENRTPVKIRVVETATKGQFALESYEIIKEEGALI